MSGEILSIRQIAYLPTINARTLRVYNVIGEILNFRVNASAQRVVPGPEGLPAPLPNRRITYIYTKIYACPDINLIYMHMYTYIPFFTAYISTYIYIPVYAPIRLPSIVSTIAITAANDSHRAPR